MRVFRRYKNQFGAALTEYTLVVALIAIVSVAGVRSVGIAHKKQICIVVASGLIVDGGAVWNPHNNTCFLYNEYGEEEPIF